MQLQPGALVEGTVSAPCAQARFLDAAAMGTDCLRPQLARGGCGGRSPARLPPPPAAGPASPSASSVLLARPPTQSAALGPGQPGSLSGRRRLSATLTSRGARRPGPSLTPGSSLCPVSPPPPYCRGDAQAAAILLLFLPEGKERRKPSGCFGRASRGPCPRGSGLEEAEAEGSARHSRAERVSPPGSGCSCQLRESSGGGGGRQGSRSFLAMERRSGAGDAKSSALCLWTAV